MKSRTALWKSLLLAAILLAGDAILHYGHAQQQTANPPKVLTAQELHLVDASGKTRVLIAVQSDGNPGIALLGKDGKIRAALRVRPDGGVALSLHDPDGNNRAALDTLPDGSSSLMLTNKSGKGGVGMVVLPSGKAALTITDADGHPVGSVP
ncbi:MAG TPA: hypothetical protein VFA07_14335 [Chthonomonadaceae bacterium]|nr:hypothetical protein [Chthonomonadaceae bacterium]